MRRRALTLELLEPRQLLAATTWPAPGRLTLSFAPDGTKLGRYQSDLFSTLGSRGDAADWQT
jgi:hypothetical protein